MIVGYMGDVPFVTSRQVLLTFDDFSRSSEGRWVKHELVGQKPVLEFLGPDTETITMKIMLRKDHGINPVKVLNQLRQMRDTGEVFPLVLGSRVIGNAVRALLKKSPASSAGLWVLRSVGESVTHWAGGTPYIVEVSVTLEEYSGRLI